jgi:hypothetical protein
LNTYYAKQSQFQKSQMNVNPYNATDYESKSNWTFGENKPNSKPIQTQSNPIAERVKLMQSVYLQRNMKKNAAKGYEKTKPKQSQSQKQKSENRSQKTDDRRQKLVRHQCGGTEDRVRPFGPGSREAGSPRNDIGFVIGFEYSI